jgi:hypothetical protein
MGKAHSSAAKTGFYFELFAARVNSCPDTKAGHGRAFSKLEAVAFDASESPTQILKCSSKGHMANTKSITDTDERKKVKRAARKKAAPKAKRTTPRGSQKKKVRKLARGQSKR